MAKTTVTTKKVDIVDLIRDRKLFPLLEVPPIRVSVVIEVTTSALLTTPPPAAPAKMARLEAAARAKFEEYEQIITQECARFSAKIDGLMKAGKDKEAETMVSEVNASVKKALASSEAAAQIAVEAAKKKEAQGDKLLTEARIKTTVKVTFTGVGIAAHAAKLGASHGTDVTAYISIAKSFLSLALELKQQLKDEPKLRKDLVDGITAYLDLRGTSVMQAIKRYGITDPGSLPGFPEIFTAAATRAMNTKNEITKGKNASTIAKDLLDFTVKAIMAKFNDVEKARQMYRNHTVKMRQKVDSVSMVALKLQNAMKAAPDLKNGVKIGAECMQVKAKVTRLAGVLDNASGFLVATETVMKGFGLQVDDRTIIEKVRAIDVSTILSEGTSLIGNLDAIYSLCSNVYAAVG